MAEYYGHGEQMNSEAVRVAALLTTSRQYEAAAKLYDRLIESATRPRSSRSWPSYCGKPKR